MYGTRRMWCARRSAVPLFNYRYIDSTVGTEHQHLPGNGATSPPFPQNSVQQQRVRTLHGSGKHGKNDRDREPASQQRPPPPSPPPEDGPDSVVFRVLRGGRTSRPEPDLVEVSLDREGAGGGNGGGGGGGLANTAQSLGEFLFLVRSSQPGSIGEELQRRGVRVFPEEAFVDEAGWGRAAAAENAGSEEAEPQADELLSRFSWTSGNPLPLDTQMEALPRDEEGRIRLVVWDPCGERQN